MRHYILNIVAFSLLFIPASAFSQEKTSFGLAMHGAPKYDASATHVDYVNPDAPKGGSIRMNAAIGTFDTLNPYSIKGKAAQGLSMVYDRLMGRVWDEPFTLYPLIAKKANVPDDRSSIEFEIDERAKFHDGTPITTDDVLFSFETLRDHGRPNMRRVYQLVQKTTKTPTSIKFELSPGYDRETIMILAMMPVLSKAYWTGKTFDSTTLDMPVLNGPYKIASIEPGRRIIYERVADYWGKDLLVNAGHNNFERVIYDYYRDDTVAFEAFKAGDLDLRREFDAGKWASAYDFPAAKDGRVTLDALPHGRPERVRAFIFNTRRAPFDDIRVRKAFDLIFDFEWANKNLFHGQYASINSYYPNSELAATGEPSAAETAILEPFRDKLDPAIFGPAYAPPVSTDESRRQNMQKADALLKEAGWKVVDGKRMKDGKPLTFEITLGAPEDEKLALHFKRSLEKMGITPSIRVIDSAAYIGRLNEYDYDMTLYYWLSTLSPGTEQILYWGCAAAKEPSRWNYAGICDPAVDAISSAIAMAKTREDLVAHVRALDRILTHGHYMIPLSYSGKDYVAYWKPVHRPEKTPLYGIVLETWWGDQAESVNPR
jgi:microcin C transport system substrate-binding protein